MHLESIKLRADVGACKAKGYPDIASRSFLRHASQIDTHHEVKLPIYALTDFDPDGIAIMSNYKHGSRNLSHENAHLIVPSIQWLGIMRCDICPPTNEEVGRNDNQGLLRLSHTDRKKATKMLENGRAFSKTGERTEWRTQLQVMLILNIKAEMEILGERNGGVEGWVEEKLVEAQSTANGM